MGILKSLLKIVFGLLLGVIIGLLIAAVGVVCFTDMTFTEYLTKLQSTSFKESIIIAGFGIFVFAVSLTIHILLHEAGHFVCGLLSGYKFESFRIFNLTFIKFDGKLRIKHYSIDGTGGQCLLTPPDLPLEEISTVWYNLGGILFNIITVFAVSPLLLIKGHPFLTVTIVIFMLTGLFSVLLNGIPMKISGSGNDAFNIMSIRKNKLAKRGLVESLRAYGMIKNGIRSKDMPEEWFVVPEGINYSDQLEASIPMMAASRMIDEMDFYEALKQYEELYSHKKELIRLYIKEIECELVFLRLMDGDIVAAKELLTPELKKYIEVYSKVMSSKERILCAMALFIDDDRTKAVEIYNSLSQKAGGYLLHGEVKSDLAIMSVMLSEKE